LPLRSPRGSFCSFASWGVMDIMQACSRCIFPPSFDLLLYAVDLPANFECGFPAPATTYGPDQLVLNPPVGGDSPQRMPRIRFWPACMIQSAFFTAPGISTVSSLVVCY
jgi:hypothetical protein